jgi:hypothetical protein
VADEDRQERINNGVAMLGQASHNNRVFQIRGFVMNPPRVGNPEFLRLQVAGDTGEALCSYTKEDCIADKGETIPDAVSLALQEHVDAVQQEVQAVLAWCRADGSIVLTKRLRARPLREYGALQIPGMSLQESAALVGNADDRAIVGQVLRTSEIHLRSYLQGHHLQAQQQRELTEAAMDQAKMSGAMTMEMYAKLMEAINGHAKLLAENMTLKAEGEMKDRKIAELEALLSGETGVDVEDADGPETDSAKAEMVRHATEMLDQAVPELIQYGKVWVASQIGKNNAAAHAAQQAAKAANGVNGHPVAE